MINLFNRVFYTKFTFILFLFSMLILVGCPVTKTYVFQGDVIMVNECSGEKEDLPAKIKMVVNLYYKSGAYSPFEKEFDTNDAGQATKTAAFQFSISSNEKADYWEIVNIFAGGRYLHPCELINCPLGSPPSCRDVAQKVRKITVTSNITNHTENINCGCI